MCTAIQIGEFKADDANSRLKWVKHLGKCGCSGCAVPEFGSSYVIQPSCRLMPKGSFFTTPWQRGICGYINILSILPGSWFVRELMIMAARSLDAAQGRDEMGCWVLRAVKAVRGGERRGCLFLVAAHCLGWIKHSTKLLSQGSHI